ncbi:MAG: serine/threonine-protein kinase [Actinobacteria bacterium]|nr:serine/threonine-protein kinase [Actinomycetota bacterium]
MLTNQQSPARTAEDFVQALEPWSSSEAAFGPGAGLDEAIDRIQAVADASTLPVLAQGLGLYLHRLRREGRLTVGQWEALLGGDPASSATGARGVLRDAIDRSIGLWDAVGLPEGARRASWADPQVAAWMLAFHGVVWGRAIARGLLASREQGAGTRALVEAMENAVSAVPLRHDLLQQEDLREVATARAFPSPGAVFGTGEGGRWRLVECIFARGSTRIYAVEAINPSSSLRDVPMVAKIVERSALPAEAGGAVENLARSSFVMRSLARPSVPNYYVDILPRAITDLHAWWAEHCHSRSRRLTGREVAAFALPMTQAVVDLHFGAGGGMPHVHGDLKLGQFLIGSPEGSALQLSDLDLVVPAAPIMRSTHSPIEAPTTVAALGFTKGMVPPDHDPERPRASRRNDTWALGVCWHLLLTNRHPADVAAGKELTDYERARTVQDGSAGVELDPGTPAPWRPVLHSALSRTSRPRPAELLPALREIYHPLGPDLVYGVVDLLNGQTLLTQASGEGGVRSDLYPTTSTRVASARALLAEAGAHGA